MSAKRDLSKIMKRLETAVATALKPTEMVALGEFTSNLVLKRTRLGYGVDKELGQKKKFAALSRSYVKSRKSFFGLSNTTSPKKSNLTRTGEMLESFGIRKVNRDGVILGVRGRRNIKLAEYHAQGNSKLPQRIFNNVSMLEYKQALRFYRTRFGDLLRKQRLIS